MIKTGHIFNTKEISMMYYKFIFGVKLDGRQKTGRDTHMSGPSVYAGEGCKLQPVIYLRIETYILQLLFHLFRTILSTF